MDTHRPKSLMTGLIAIGVIVLLATFGYSSAYVFLGKIEWEIPSIYRVFATEWLADIFRPAGVIEAKIKQTPVVLCAKIPDDPLGDWAERWQFEP